MNKNESITAVIDIQFTASGCWPMMAETTDIDYYHGKTDLYLRYSEDLLNGPFQALSNLTEIVVVTSDQTMLEARSGEIPCEVIKLMDLTEFLRFRASSKECASHRAARQALEEVQDQLADADAKMSTSARAVERAKAKVATATATLRKANDAHLAATAAYFAAKPPRFVPMILRD